jgi:pimeloyl-ACP methyl ester carboxylesterase
MPPGIPIVLICGMGPRTFPSFLPTELKEEVRKDRTIFYPAKLKFHRAWVEQFPGGQLVVTENSGHGIPFEEPGLIVRTIREVLERVRQPHGTSLAR